MMTNELKRKLAIVFGFTFIDLLGYSLILPLLPYIAERFNAGPVQVGLLLTANALSQMIAGPVIGRLSDRWGRRPMLLISIAGTVIAFLLFAFARSMAMLYVSRVVDGLLGGNTSLARAYITDVTDEKTRSRGLGLIGAAFGLGFTIGPFTGGMLSQYGYMVPGLVAAGLSFLNLIAVFFWLPESLDKSRRREAQGGQARAFDFKRLFEALRTPCVGGLLLIGFWFSLSFTLFEVNFVLVAKEGLNLDVRTTSILLSLVGVLSILTQGVLVGWLTDRFREKHLLLASTFILTAGLAVWGFTPNVIMLAVIMIPISISAGLANVVSTSLLTKASRAGEVGGILGFTQSQQSFARILAPLAGGPLIQYVGAPAVGLLGTLLMGIAAVTETRVFRTNPDLNGPCGDKVKQG
jgi:DHA1 family tetracycline resistance protein-like MFS transporter